MATPGKLSKKELKKLPLSKASLASPFSPTWSPLPQEDMHFILETLKDKLASVGLVKEEVKVFRPWRKNKKKEEKTDDATATTEPVTPKREPPKNGWTDVAVRRQLAIGINEVTKALERNELRLLLVCKSVKPSHMTSHLIALSATRSVPACQVPRLSQSVSEALGLKSVLALGFRHCNAAAAAGEQGVFADTVDLIKPRVPSLNVSWLSAEVASNESTNIEEEGEEEEEDEEEEVAKQSGGQKRKLESESPSAVSLQPLKVKRIVANPARKNKMKRKAKAKGKTA